MARELAHWIAGPISYKRSDTGAFPDRTVHICKWEFIGGTASGELRRWHLAFSIETRKFTTNTLSVSDWDKAHARDLASFYRPVSVLRHMLPKGSITVALKSMVPAKDIAQITALALRGSAPNG